MRSITVLVVVSEVSPPREKREDEEGIGRERSLTSKLKKEEGEGSDVFELAYATRCDSTERV